jgi:general stress protein 26
MNETIMARAAEIILQNIGSEHFCVLALMDLDGSPTASTISVAKADGLSKLAFCTGLSGPKKDRIKNCKRASVCFSDHAYNITLVGAIELSTDPMLKKEMWYNGLEEIFSGPDDPDYCVLLFKTERYNLFVDWKMATGTL